MASDYPIEEQAGPTQKQLDAMKPVTQKFSKLVNQPLMPQTGVSAQRTKLENNIHKALVSYIEAKQSADMSKEKAMDSCAKNFAKDLASILADVISAQAINVTTTVTTAVTTVVVGSCPAGAVAGSGNGTGTGTGTATPKQITST